MRKNKRELPCEFTTGKRRSVESSLFGFSDRQTLVSHVSKKNKAVVLLSTMHNDNKVDKETGLPEMVLDYKATRAAVNQVDQLCHYYSVQKNTKRWPLAYFHNRLNIAGINSMVIFQSKFSQGKSQATHSRRVFLENLGMSLLHPWLQSRVQVKQLPKDTKLALQKCGYTIDIEASQSATHQGGKRKRRRCYICPASMDRKTANMCKECGEPCSVGHKQVTILCSYCAA